MNLRKQTTGMEVRNWIRESQAAIEEELGKDERWRNRG